MLTQAEQVSRVRSLVDEPTAAIATDNEIFAWLADADIQIIVAIRERSPEILQKQYTLTTVVGQEQYDVPADFHKIIYVAATDKKAVYANPFAEGVSCFNGKIQVNPIPLEEVEYEITYITTTSGLNNNSIALANIAYAIAQFYKKDRNFTVASAYMAEYLSLIGKIVKDVCKPATRRGVFGTVAGY